MLKSVENQKNEYLKIKDSLDADLVEYREKLAKLNEEKESIKELCQNLQKDLSKPAS